MDFFFVAADNLQFISEDILSFAYHVNEAEFDRIGGFLLSESKVDTG